MSESTNSETVSQDASQLPDWARSAITRANEEAAKFRVEKNTAIADLEGAQKLAAENAAAAEKSAADLVNLQTEVNGSKLEVTKLRAAIAAGIPADKLDAFVPLLQGDSEETIRSHADQLKELFGTSTDEPKKTKALDPSQGSGGTLPLNGDGLLNAVKHIVGA